MRRLISMPLAIALEPARLTIRSAHEAGGTSTLVFVPAEDAPAASP